MNDRKTAMVFAGQGAQFAGMGRDLAERYPDCRDLFARADRALGYELSKICFDGTDDDLTPSDRCQPAVFIVSAACHTAFRLNRPEMEFEGAAGLSLGEWSALHVAGALSFEDTVKVLEARGRYMQEACERRPGGMLSVIGLTVDTVRDIADRAGVTMANVNSPEQIVLSGEINGLDRAEQLAGQAGAKRAIRLKVAGAYHSPLMAPAAERLAALLETVDLRTPQAPVISNVTGMPHGAPADIKANMVKQVCSPVQWVKCVQWFMDNGVSSYIEFGPGRVLTGLIKRIDKSAALYNIQDNSTLEKTVKEPGFGTES